MKQLSPKEREDLLASYGIFTEQEINQFSRFSDDALFFACVQLRKQQDIKNKKAYLFATARNYQNKNSNETNERTTNDINTKNEKNDSIDNKTQSFARNELNPDLSDFDSFSEKDLNPYQKAQPTKKMGQEKTLDRFGNPIESNGDKIKRYSQRIKEAEEWLRLYEDKESVSSFEKEFKRDVVQHSLKEIQYLTDVEKGIKKGKVDDRITIGDEDDFVSIEADNQWKSTLKTHLNRIKKLGINNASIPKRYMSYVIQLLEEDANLLGQGSLITNK